MRNKRWLFLLPLLLMLFSYTWAGQDLSPNDIYNQYGCKECHAEKGEITDKGLRQLEQGLG